ncbi:MAG: hypothetical protein ACLUO4_08355 [Christensenellales bacterium]
MSDVKISGRGVKAVIDGQHICAGNDKLMKDIGVAWHDCHMVGTIVHVAIDGVCRAYRNFRRSETGCQAGNCLVETGRH